MKLQYWYGLGAALIVAVLFQFFFRYDYVHQSASTTYRIDRLTQASCVMPCIPSSPPPAPLPYDKQQAEVHVAQSRQEADIQAIEIAKTNREAIELMQQNGRDYEWQASLFDDITAGDRAAKTDAPEKIATVRLVCYCDKKGSGWRFEVHTDTKQVNYVNDNQALEKKWGLI